jgi:RHS repeat-associated protein
MKTVYLRILLFHFTILFSVCESNAQSLTLETAGADLLVGANNFSAVRSPSVDVHDNTGIRIYTWAESQDPTNASGQIGNKDIYCQIFDKDMNAMTSSFRVNKVNTLDQGNPVVKINQSDYSFVVAWNSNHSSTNNYDIYAKKLDIYLSNPADVINQDELLINVNIVNPSSTTTNGRQITPYLAFDYTYNELVVIWRDQDGQDNPANTSLGVNGIFARRMNYSNFTLIKDQWLVNTTTVDQQVLNSADINPVNGDLYVAYQSFTSTYDYDVMFRKFTRNSTTYDFEPQTETLINITYRTYYQQSAYITINKTTGDYVIGWSSNNEDGSLIGAYFRPFDKFNVQIPLAGSATQKRVSVPTSNNQQIPKAVWDEASGYLIYFYSYSQVGTANIKYQLFDNTFTASNGEMPACSTSSGEINVVYSWPNIAIGYSQQKKQVSLAYQVYGTSNYSKLYVRSFKFSSPSTNVPPCPIDNAHNWSQVTTYDELGNEISSVRNYSDKLGRETQTQVKNIIENKILVSTTLYDSYGNPSIETLPAPIIESCFFYSPNFITNQSNTSYDYNDFDKDITTGNSLGEINNPKPVSNSFQGTLGNYYSTSNNLEPYNPTTSYPYSRVDYNSQGYGVLRASSPGEKLRMGQLHEGSSVTLPILGELNHYLSLRHHYVPGNTVYQYTTRGTKSISKDQNGTESISFYDAEGKVLATCLSGSVGGVNQNNIVTPDYYSVVTAYTSGNAFNIINSTSDVEIFISTSPFIYYAGPSSGAPSGTSAFPTGVSVTVKSLSSFQVTLGASTYTAALQSSGVDFLDYLDVHVPEGEQSTLTITPGSVVIFGSTVYSTYQILDMQTGNVVTASPVPAGYYRIRKTSGYAPIYVKNTLNYYNFTYYYYDDADRLVATISPNAVNLASSSQPVSANTYEYNTLGWTLAQSSPDEGRTEYVYQPDGSIRFSQNALQRNQNKFSYSNYNSIKQVTETGEYASDDAGSALYFQNMKDYYNSVAIPSGHGYVNAFTVLNNTDGIDDARCTEVSYMDYDSPDAGLSSIISGYSQRFVNGNISKTYKKSLGTDASNLSTTWYSYDESGNLEWMVKSLNDLGVKTTEYVYDLSGNVLNVIYQKNTSTERFEHKYEYDLMQRLEYVRTRRLSTDAFKQQARYYYYLHGPLKRVELENNLQGIDYTYTINGWLKGINHPNLDNNDPGGDSYTGPKSAFSKDVFGMALEYYQDDYVRDSKFLSSSGLPSGDQLYNGTITSWTWNTRETSTIPTPAQYSYKYDKKYQLTQADFGTHNTSTNLFTASSSNAYQVSNLTYDKNGNILSMRRKNDTGTNTFDSYYQITSNTNKLTTTSSDAGGSTITRTLSYDVIGQMTASTTAISGEKDKYVDYDVYGNVTAVYSDAAKLHPLVTYLYDETGGRIRKTSYNTISPYFAISETYYVRDAVGNVQCVYDASTTLQIEFPIYGINRIGTAFLSTGSIEYDYELKDHLGNVRAVIRRNSSTSLLEVSKWTDYYPHGSVMPGRNFTSSPGYRNGYQGEFAEHSAETGWEEFDLRMYDSNLGRWFAPDPYEEFHSPYLAMGNDPVNLIDPDGGKILPYGPTTEVYLGNILGRVDAFGEVTITPMYGEGYEIPLMDRLGNVMPLESEMTSKYLQSQAFHDQMIESISKGPHKVAYTGFWEKVDYYLNGRIENGYSYDLDGNGRGRAPITGEPPGFGFGGKIKALRSISQKKEFLKELGKSGKVASWMKQWLKKGKNPPGYDVDHIKPISVGGKDLPKNMRLIDRAFHRMHHKRYRPWTKKK